MGSKVTDEQGEVRAGQPAAALARLDPAWGVTVVRLMAGLILVVAGFQKFAMGVGGFAGFVGNLGIPAAGLLAPLVAVLELVGGALVLAGLRARWLGVLFLLEFLVVAFFIKLPRMGWDAARIDLMMLAAAIMLIVAGAGRASLDEYLARRQA